jgi:hypothetical protein
MDGACRFVVALRQSTLRKISQRLNVKLQVDKVKRDSACLSSIEEFDSILIPLAEAVYTASMKASPATLSKHANTVDLPTSSVVVSTQELEKILCEMLRHSLDHK